MSEGKRQLTIELKSDGSGHLVEWTRDGVTGTLGPYLDKEMAQRVMEAKERELTENKKAI